MSTPELGSSQPKVEWEPPPLDQSRDFGWVLVLVGAAVLLFASWTLFPTDARGMWAGYLCSLIAILGGVGAFWLHSTLPRAPGVAVCLLAGLGMVVLGLFQLGHGNAIAITEIAGGALMVVGAALQG